MPDDVATALEAAATALRAEAVKPGGDFPRAASYLQRVEQLARRWTAGEPAHTPRAAKGPGQP